jgi:hypothetical protein
MTFYLKITVTLCSSAEIQYTGTFDKVPAERLLKKVKAHGIKSVLLLWIRNWLTGRRQRVVLDGQFSDWIAVL